MIFINTSIRHIMIHMHFPKIISALGMLMLLFSSAQAANVAIKEIDFSSLPEDKVQIFVRGSGNLPTPTSFTTDNPARLAIDFANVSSKLSKMRQAIGVGTARSYLALEAGKRTRLIINLTDPSKYKIDVNGNVAVITLSGGSGEALAAAKPAAVAAPSPIRKTAQPSKPVIRALQQKPRHMATGGRRINNIDFRRGSSGEGRLLISLSDPKTVVNMIQKGDDIVVDFIGTSLPQRLMRKFDVVDFSTPAQFIESAPVKGNTRITIKAKGDYEHLAYQTDNNYVVELRGLSQQELESRREKSYTGERLSLNFQNIEVRSVLQLLADFTGLNLVVSDTVGGNITLRLQNVPWDHALDIILKTKGLSMRRKDNVVLIAPTEEIAARERLELESQKQVEELAPLRSEWMRLSYAKAEDIATLLQEGGSSGVTTTTTAGAADDGMLSSRGSVSFDARTNTLLVKDTARKLEEIRQMLKVLDIPIKQVLIESRVVIANDDFTRDIGVKWGAAYTDPRLTYNPTDRYITSVGGALTGDMDHTGWMGGTIFNTGGNTNENLLVNLPVTNPTSGLNFVIGKFASHLVRLELTAMQSEGKGEIISSPRVITSDQTKATIKQGIEIPYQEASSSGATTVAFKEAVLQMEVTPSITPDDRVKMELNISNDEADFTNVVLGVPSMTTREVNTTVLVDNGETVVLGGIFEKTKSVDKDKVPVLGDLPVVGRMFRKELTTNDNSELLIFVTPKIMKENVSGR